jgi:dephospho-CoA kinase
MRLIGISGTNGSGKDTLAVIMEKDFGFCFISVSDMLRNELKKRNVPIERQNLRQLSHEWRIKHGLGYLIDRAVKEFKPKQNKFKGLVVSSLRNHGEAKRLHGLGGQVVWLDAEPRLRYGRIMARNRSEEDDKTFNQFIAEEQAEMEGTDQAALDLANVKKMADIFLMNDYTDLEHFKTAAQKALGL